MSSIKIRAKQHRGAFLLDMNVEIPMEGVTAIFGKSGAGKSSLLRLIAGLDKVPDGQVEFNGLTWQNNQSWMPAHKRQIGYVFQSPSLFEHLSVRGNLEYAYKRAKASDLDFETLSELGIKELLERKASSLSGGEKQRVAIARALASNPKVLLMDEPVSALDARSKEEVLSLIQNLQKKVRIPILYVSHSLDEVARLADQIILVRDGCFVAKGETVNMLLHPEIAQETESRLETIIDAEVVELDEQYGLCRLAFGGGDLWVANQQLQPGDKSRARIMARDLSITLDHQQGTSIQNIVAASVVAVRDSSGPQVVIELDAGGCRLLAQVTRRAKDRLGLSPGKQVYAQIKSVALLS